MNEYERGIYESREQLAEWMIDHGFATGHCDSMVELLKELEWQIRERNAARQTTDRPQV